MSDYSLAFIKLHWNRTLYVKDSKYIDKKSVILSQPFIMYLMFFENTKTQKPHNALTKAKQHNIILFESMWDGRWLGCKVAHIQLLTLGCPDFANRFVRSQP